MNSPINWLVVHSSHIISGFWPFGLDENYSPKMMVREMERAYFCEGGWHLAFNSPFGFGVPKAPKKQILHLPTSTKQP
jgi:hypothetical protein